MIALFAAAAEPAGEGGSLLDTFLSGTFIGPLLVAIIAAAATVINGRRRKSDQRAAELNNVATELTNAASGNEEYRKSIDWLQGRNTVQREEIDKMRAVETELRAELEKASVEIQQLRDELTAFRESSKDDVYEVKAEAARCQAAQAESIRVMKKELGRLRTVIVRAGHEALLEPGDGSSHEPVD